MAVAKRKKGIAKAKTGARKITGKKPITKVSVKRSAAKVKKITTKTAKIQTTYTKTELLTDLAERTELTKKQVNSVFENLLEIISLHLKKGGPEEFKLPGILKVKVKKVAARKARKGINPFTGEETTFKAKPASRKVKVLALKKLKEAVGS